MKAPYIFHSKVIVRTPRLPFVQNILEADIESLFNDVVFLESIYLASPVLYRECIKYRDGLMQEQRDILKLKNSIVKYYLRTVSRCTPFGLFSGCCVSKWQEGTTRGLVINDTTARHTRLDMHYLCALAQQLAKKKGIKEYLLYYANNSLYSIGDEMRYIEYKYFSGKRIHQISSVNTTDYLDQILQQASNGISVSDIKAILAAPEISNEEISDFLDEILDAQLLVSELEPALTGPEFIHQIIDVLKRIVDKSCNKNVSEIIDILEKTNDKLNIIDTAAYNTADDYKKIMLLLEKLEVPYEESKLFQTDLVTKSVEGGIPIHFQEELLKALDIMNRFGTYYSNNANLENFIKRFSERYEDLEIPLLEALDTETGIGYLETGLEPPLVADIVFSKLPSSVTNYKWTPVEKYLVNKVADAYRQNEFIVEIKEEEMDGLANDNWGDLPPSMSLMFRVVGANKNLLFIESCGGSSAINLLARFAHADNKIYELAKSIASSEETLNPNVTFAEIIHLPESRVGNILLHPAFRAYEIPYLSKSSLPKENQVDVQDLVICTRFGKLFLRNKKTGNIIVPRLSNAHNFQFNALPVYQFLSDMQTNQLRGGLVFTWGSLVHHHKFLPRVQYKNVILYPATWRFVRSDFNILFDKEKKENQTRLLAAFKVQFNLPTMIVLADGDNELFINLENDVSIRIFLDTIHNRSSFELKEFLGSGQMVKNTDDAFYNSQILASLIKTVPTYNNFFKSKEISKQNKRTAFIPGSEWLYFKIYCGAKSADTILTGAIKTATDALLKKEIIDKFFFIRYYDPDFHIRLRIRFTPGMAIGEAMQTIHDHLQKYHDTGHIWKIQTDTYFSEFERYGRNTIDIAESIFCYDSEAVLKMLGLAWGDEREQLRWLWAMRSVDELLNSFNYSIEQKLDLAFMMKEAFAKEFKMDKFLKEQLNVKFRIKRSSIESVMCSDNNNINYLIPLLEILHVRTNDIKPLALKLIKLEIDHLLEVQLHDLLSSYIHMLINRIITSKPRLHELVIYDFLYRFYKSMSARKNITIKIKD